MTLIQVSKLSFAYDESYENVFEDVSFQMDSEWKLGFIGRNGRGKTTFLKLLLGLYAYKGEIRINLEKTRKTTNRITSPASAEYCWNINLSQFRSLYRFKLAEGVEFIPLISLLSFQFKAY